MIYLAAAMSSVVIITTGLWWYARYAKWDMDRLAALKKWSNGYFDCATTLAANKKAPTPLLRDILALNRSLDDSREPQKLIKILKAIPAGRIKADRHGTEIREFLRREKLADVHRQMATSYILTISYKDIVRGPRIRKLIASGGHLEEIYDGVKFIYFWRIFLVIAATAGAAWIWFWLGKSGENFGIGKIYLWNLVWFVAACAWIWYWFIERGFAGRFLRVATGKVEELITPQERVVGAVTHAG